MADIQGTSLQYFFIWVLYRLVQCPQQHAKTTRFSWFHFWAKWIILQHLLVNLSRCVWIIFRLNFKTFFWWYMLSPYLSLILLSNAFPKEPSIYDLQFWWLASELSHLRHSEQVCSIVSGLLFSFCSRTYSIVMARCLCSLYLKFVMFMILLLMIACIRTIGVGCKDGRYDLKISGKHQRLVFVFSMEIILQNQNFFPWPQPWWHLGLPLNHVIFILQSPYPYCHSPCKIREPFICSMNTILDPNGNSYEVYLLSFTLAAGNLSVYLCQFSFINLELNIGLRKFSWKNVLPKIKA